MAINGGLRYSTTIQMQDAPPVVMGVDVGQKHDPTAVAVVEAFPHDRVGRRQEYTFETRHLERLPLGTDYRNVGRRIVDIVLKIQQRGRPANVRPPQITIVVDATGVGTPVIDILRGEMEREGIKVKLTEATFTHGDRLTGHSGQRRMSVGKGYLVSRLKSLLQTDRVFLPANHPEAAAMATELLDYEIRVDENANDRYGAFRTGTHDDLATALGLAVLTDPRTPGRLHGA